MKTDSTKKTPLISCLCITKNKLQLLQRAVKCFLNQSYPNKELIVLFEDGNDAVLEYSKSLNLKNIKFVAVPIQPKLTLGELRNLSIQASSGEYFCQWDDDDWYHNDRLSFQFNEMIANGKQASALAYKIIFNMSTSESYLSGVGPWPGTIICQTSLIGNDLSYPALSRHEDADFLDQLSVTNRLFPVIKPSLYIYIYHGNNTFGSEHFDLIFSMAQPLPASISFAIEQIITEVTSPEDASSFLFSHELLKELNYMHRNA
ncbi:glycosyltransferase family 2 protein [Mucilaginibacter sp. OK098]|uniref:glycosyltransferase family 2 protein n=1 Tax=Mucilaginibacter sp. OK098 TaxID=1855297 RepID=UPI00091E3060|nr:glycosyltransferase family 2 protein [Mucilaginibacter sp. OK098]SHN36113.1 Glycosyltransferase involved in cell wall bisynthesis [Mucilaginibacter sp. OK098]